MSGAEFQGGSSTALSRYVKTNLVISSTGSKCHLADSENTVRKVRYQSISSV